MAHRDSLTGLSIPGVSRAQAEVYKIGEWLIQHDGCELLLPEGFFAGSAAQTGKEQGKGEAREPECSKSMDIKTLVEKLSDNRAFVNAELLLKRNYPLRLRQVEDPKTHRSVGELIRKLVNCGQDNSEYLRVKSDLDRLQERRTAAMIQRIPEIIQAEFRGGNIQARKAIFTIGLSHLPRIIRYLEEDRVKIYSPLLAGDKKEDDPADLKLKKENFGVAVYLPYTLASDRKILKMTGLDEIIERHRRHNSSSPFPNPGN
jgi:hypothetical protein